MTVGVDKVIRFENGGHKAIKTKRPEKKIIPANTIVVNTNLVRKDYSAFHIYHECIHYQLHYMFFRLQEMGSNDVRLIKAIEAIQEDNKGYSNPIYFMEKQTNRGAFALMMPAGDMTSMIAEECSKADNCRHFGEQFEIAGKAISKRLRLPHFRVRARMIQLGFIEAKGALNYADRKLIQPFAFNIDSWRTGEQTFVLNSRTSKALYSSSDDFRAILDSGEYIYADGHIVRNDPRYVRQSENGLLLTPWANAHVDDCCLRFERQ